MTFISDIGYNSELERIEKVYFNSPINYYLDVTNALFDVGYFIEFKQIVHFTADKIDAVVTYARFLDELKGHDEFNKLPEENIIEELDKKDYLPDHYIKVTDSLPYHNQTINAYTDNHKIIVAEYSEKLGGYFMDVQDNSRINVIGWLQIEEF